MNKPLFRSFFMGGLECSSHRLRTGKRLDVLAATRHDRYVLADYLRLQAQGLHTIRSGIRWHLIERRPGRYDFSGVLPMLRAARSTGLQVIWDLCHYGWPDDIDIFTPAFVRRFADLAAAFARLLAAETEDMSFLVPVNEISFFSWAGGDGGHLNPYVRGRSFELKAQLVLAAIEAMEAIWQVLPRTRFVHVDPIVHIVSDPVYAANPREAEAYRTAQYQAWDMLSGREWPLLGGDPKYLDIIGVNFYPYNQWVYKGPTLERDDPRYRPFRDMLYDVYERYGRPLFLAETGTEGEARAAWLRYVAEEVVAARAAGVPVEGICLYPIFNHPGWVDDRHCHNGLWDYADAQGERVLYEPLARELRRQQCLLAQERPEPHEAPRQANN